MKSNNELVIEAQSGNINAFEILVDKFRNMAIGYAYSVLKDYHYAEDAAQEAFVQAYFKLKTLQSPEAFPSWFRKIVFSQCEHFYRKSRLPVLPLDDVLEIQSQDYSPSEIAERNELKRQLFNSVAALPEKERTITVLFYISEYSTAEISDFLDLPISTVKNRLFSARKKLQKELVDNMSDTFKTQKSSKEFTERVKNMIVSGYKHALFMKEDGTVMTWGDKTRFAAVAGLKNVKSLAAASGHNYSFALLVDGTVWGWGDNCFSQLGTGSREKYVTIPEQVKSLSDVVSISAGVAHALALKKDGSVWSWGKNWYGQLGSSRRNAENRKIEDSEFPSEIPGLKKITQISAGYFRSLALAEDGTVWRWGGYGDSRFSFPIVYEADTPVQIKITGKITAISAGGMHDVMLCEDGTVWACGYNTQKQLGSVNICNEILDVPVKVRNLSEVSVISAGGSFTLALKKDGTVWAWGLNENGELGCGSYDANSEFTLEDHVKNEPVKVCLPQTVVEITAGGSHAMAVTGDGGIWAWGSNDEGQLGDFSENKQCVPQRIMSL
ncbi:MAG: sigma-70 family RNA polymerase sigma factor [Oscillospiraceae bacterium]|nr:sigma-70 family RNA polymerase sigma factor [Oscillospiraceae bacterium]